ncbi:uncharacterized protein BXZ73DRAFT_93226 [Epithele typhae]|uniref:uncharacterized protein n=1 Tax=Epithele typhae TaxID=378194 RepID=UPI0020081886|nr:uncharacterized protein BXZ73DRAFT_93226 [Epithele typhae]KAH9912256.1 hypothetical protein BXZ73DRAFT_93226 [Epithele typhae]
MPQEVASGGGSTRSKPATRSSIRQSFGLSSMSKALADALHKDKESEKEREKLAKKKDTSHRRSSTINLAPAPATISSSRRKENSHLTEDSSDAKTITRHSRRQSALRKLAGQDEAPAPSPSSSPSDSASPPKASISARSGSGSVRQRSGLTSSSLPKYKPKDRPRSMLGGEVIVAPKAPSPTHQARRRRTSSSDDETDEVKTPKELEEGGQKGQAHAPAAERLTLIGVEDEQDVRPTAIGRGVGRSSVPRPPSSASSSVSGSGGSVRSSAKGSNSLRLKNVSGGSSPKSPSPSPLGRTSSRKLGKSAHTRYTSAPVEFPSPDSSFDSFDADDVEFMLGSSFSPTAPTPSIPRTRLRVNDASDPHTPIRGGLPSRANLSYVSPAPPSSSTENSPFLRPRLKVAGNDRGSILSWEQLAKHSKLDDEEVERMISEMPAPFRPGAISPALSTIDLPDSPTISAMPSPTGYGSISQVLLPDVTPSPAMHNTAHLFDVKPETPTHTDGAALTLLRLQLAAAEQRAQDRLQQMQALEEQLHASKVARAQDAEDLSKQISELEQQVHSNLLIESQRSEQIAVLEDMLRDAQDAQDAAAKAAARKAKDAMGAGREAEQRAKQVQARAGLALAAKDVGAAWGEVRHAAEGELELVRQNKDMLAVLLLSLDQTITQLSCA